MRPRSVGVASTLPLLALVAIVVAAVCWAETTSAQPGALSLVYVDTGKPGASDVWVTSLDGAAKRLAGTLGKDARPLDLRGSLLVLASDPDLVILDLASGATKRTAAGTRISSAYITADGAANGSVFFTTRVGCGPNDEQTLLGQIDTATGTRSDLAEMEEPGAEILWHNPTTDEILLTPRGCDPGVWALRLLDGKTGDERSSLEVQGCGWVAVSPNGKQVLVSFAFCSGGDFPEMNVYGLPDGDRREVRYAKDAPSNYPSVYAPDGSRAAYGLALARGNPGGTAKSGGIWLLDTASLTDSKLWQDQGSESWAIDWSPDGTKLVVASVEAQGRCRYYVVDVASGEAAPVEGVNGCGANGTLVGFVTLP